MKRFPGDDGGPRRVGLGNRAGGFVRPPAGPEHNLIQRPDITQLLVDRFGVRQAHLTPTLMEGVQPVVLVEDLTSGSLRGLEQQFFANVVSDWTTAVLAAMALVYMPTTARTVARMKSVQIGMLDQGGLNGTYVGWAVVRNTDGTSYVGSPPNFVSGSGDRGNRSSVSRPNLAYGGGTNNTGFYVSAKTYCSSQSSTGGPTELVDLAGVILAPGDYIGVLVTQGGTVGASTFWSWTEEPF